MSKMRVAGAVLLLVAGMSAPVHAASQPPTISGKPASWVYVGSTYSFRPTASDPDSTNLGFTMANKPAWASFNTSTGQLSGKPTAVGMWTDVRIAVSDGTSTRALSSFSIRATRRDNTAPRLSGSPAASVVIGASYSFQPTSSDAEHDPLRFSIANRPAWATFDSLSGRLSGTPSAASVGTYSNIAITVTDGTARVALPAFSITVSDTQIGAAFLSWEPPTTNTDGSALTNLAGYRIVYGASAQQLTQTIQITNAGMSAYVVENLAPGTYYFAVRAYTSKGVESADSNVVPKVVR